jgi:DNA-binding beta-propeller fold protein YncE
MRRKRTVVGAAVVALVAAGAVVSHAAMSGDPVVRTIAVQGSPWAVAIDGTTAHAFVVNRMGGAGGFYGDEGAVSELDTATGSVLHTVSVGPDPRDIAIDTRTGRAFVANDDNASVSVIDSHGGGLVRALGVGPQPRAVALDTGAHRAFVINTGDGSVSVVDTRQATVVRTLHIDQNRLIDSARAAGVSPYSSVGQQYMRGLGANPGFTPGYYQSGAVVDGQTHRVFVGGAGVVTVLDATSGAFLRTVSVPGDSTHMAVDTATGQVFATGANGLSVLDGRSGRVVGMLAAGGAASAVAVDARRGRVFVAHTGTVDNDGTPAGTGSVSILDAHSGSVLREIAVGVAPVAVAVDDETGQAVVVNAGGPVQVHTAWTWVPPSLQHLVPFGRQPSGTKNVAGSVSVLDPNR